MLAVPSKPSEAKVEASWGLTRWSFSQTSPMRWGSGLGGVLPAHCRIWGEVWFLPGVKTPIPPDGLDGGDGVEGVGSDGWRRVRRVRRVVWWFSGGGGQRDESSSK